MSSKSLGVRFTPTCVGNTNCTNVRPCCSAVHPHVRGEYDARLDARIHHLRFTPTCVGNTSIPSIRSIQSIGSPPRAWGIRTGSASRSCPPAVHPHVRGEYVPSPLICSSSCGSPPRAWGIPGRRGAGHRPHRFTPTCVGNTMPRSVRFGAMAVHPHVRGEYVTYETPAIDSAGSPPRAWGIPDTSDRAWRRRSVHPHVRGEYVGDQIIVRG